MAVSNIERFNDLAGRVLAALYESFPVPRELPCGAFGVSSDASGNGKKNDDLAFFMATLCWLKESGYLTYKNGNHVVVFDAVLTPKGLEALCAIPESLIGKPPLGDRLRDAAADGAKTTIEEVMKLVLSVGACHLFR